MIFLALFFSVSSVRGAEPLRTIRTGRRGELLPERVVTPGLKAGTPRSAPVASEAPVDPLAPGEDASGEGAAKPPLPRTHLASPALVLPASPTTALDGALSAPAEDAPAGEAVLRAPGRREWVVGSDGLLAFRPVLRTWEGAACTLRILDATGKERLFDGAPLFTWSRPDDRAHALPRWKGKDDPDAVREESPGNWTPRDDLRYVIPLRAGERVVLELTGRPADDARLELGGVALHAP